MHGFRKSWPSAKARAVAELYPCSNVQWCSSLSLCAWDADEGQRQVLLNLSLLPHARSQGVQARASLEHFVETRLRGVDSIGKVRLARHKHYEPADFPGFFVCMAASSLGWLTWV